MANNDTRSKKISQLNAANTTSNADLLYLVQNGTSMSINVGTIVPQQGFTTGPIERTINVVSNGQHNVAWFSYSTNTYCGVKLLVDGYNPTEIARTFGDIIVTSAGTNNSIGADLAYSYGSNGMLNLAAYFSINLSANIATISLTVGNTQSNSNVVIRYQATYFLIV